MPKSSKKKQQREVVRKINDLAENADEMEHMIDTLSLHGLREQLLLSKLAKDYMREEDKEGG